MRSIVLSETQRRGELSAALIYGVVVFVPVFTNLRTMVDNNRPHNEDKPVCLNKMKDRQEHNQQVMGYNAFSMPRLVQMLQRVMEMSCRRACQLLSCSIENLLCDRLSICSGQKEQQQHTLEHHTAASAWCPPSTILIVNISNSTLIDCVIGSEGNPPAVVEKQPLMQRTLQDVHDPSRCYSRHRGPAPTSSIQINSSNLSWVIIGDNNYMQVEQTVPSEEESGGVCEDSS